MSVDIGSVYREIVSLGNDIRDRIRTETRAAVLREVRDWLKEQIEVLKDDYPKIDFSVPEEAAYLMAMTDTLEEFGPRGRFAVGGEEGEQ